MNVSGRTLLVWAPRALGILAALFLATFAADSLGAGPGELILHLVPSLLLLAIVAAGWRRPLVGAAGFLLLAGLYVATTLQRPDWILSIAGPLLLVGVLFLLSWRYPVTEPGR